MITIGIALLTHILTDGKSGWAVFWALILFQMLVSTTTVRIINGCGVSI